jgi:hypothetical protein
MTLFRKRPKHTPALPPEPPVGAMVQEIWANSDVYRRTLNGWQMFDRLAGKWYRPCATWEGLHLIPGGFVVLDVTAPAHPEGATP